MGGKILQKWGLQSPFNPYNYLRVRVCTKSYFNPLSPNPTKWPYTLKQFANKLSTNCLNMFDHFVRLAYGDTTQFVWLWKKLTKQVLYFLCIYIYIYILYIYRYYIYIYIIYIYIYIYYIYIKNISQIRHASCLISFSL